MGGSGATSALDRDLTAIERRVLSDVLRPFLAVHQAGLTPVMPLHLEIGNFLGCSAELTAWPATDLYLIADYTAKVEGKIDWGFRFAFPLGSTIDAIERSAVEAPALSLDDQDRKRSLQAALRDVPVSSTIDIGRSELTLTDVTTLAPGDVVLLDRKKDAWLDFRIEGVIKYRGTLGRTGKSLAFKVAQVVETRSVAKKKA